MSAKLILATWFVLSMAPAPVYAQLGPKDGAGLPATELDRVKVGQAAPDFTLEESGGKSITLSDFRGKKSVILVFYRGYWWPFCVEQLGKLKSLLTKPEKEKTQILAVSVDNHDESKKFAEMLRKRFEGEFDFPLLEDKEHRVIDRYGVFNPDGKGWPHPSTFVIDPKGIVRWRFIEVNYEKRPANAQIRRELARIK